MLRLMDNKQSLPPGLLIRKSINPYETQKIINQIENNRIIVVLDLNGLLIQRAHIKEIPRKFWTLIDQNPNYGRIIRSPAHRGRILFPRPGLFEFLKYIFDNYRVAIFTSMSRKNTTEILTHIMTPFQIDKLLFMITSDNQIGVSEYDFYPEDYGNGKTKSIRRIIECYRHLGLTWNNIILCDDSWDKVMWNPSTNYVIIPSFNYQTEFNDNMLRYLACEIDCRKEYLLALGTTPTYRFLM